MSQQVEGENDSLGNGGVVSVCPCRPPELQRAFGSIPMCLVRVYREGRCPSSTSSQGPLFQVSQLFPFLHKHLGERQVLEVTQPRCLQERKKGTLTTARDICTFTESLYRKGRGFLSSNPPHSRLPNLHIIVFAEMAWQVALEPLSPQETALKDGVQALSHTGAHAYM